jgi:chromosomal replication initiation ATPase DnaA
MVTLDLIYGVMTNFYHQTFRLSRSRSPKVAEKKQMFAMLARHYGHRVVDIRDYMGWRNHGSVCHATKVMRGFVDVYPKVQKETVEILNSVDKAAGVGYLVFDSAV